MPTVNIKTVKKCALGSYDKKRINDYENLLSSKLKAGDFLFLFRMTCSVIIAL